MSFQQIHLVDEEKRQHSFSNWSGIYYGHVLLYGFAAKKINSNNEKIIDETHFE